MGIPPCIVGAWWGRAGVCLARAKPMGSGQSLMEIVYEPCALSPATETETGLSNHGQMINALRCAVERLGKLEFTVALGIPSSDIFIKNIEIPAGLTTKQIEQISVVEAVSNLPVPPEEICADFIKANSESATHTERIEIAFCKRGLVDELGVIAEDAGIVLSVVDREVQAIHDAAVWCASCQSDLDSISYPLGMLIESDEKTFIVSRSALDHVAYVIKSIGKTASDLVGATDSVQKDLQTYCRRAGLDFENGMPLRQLFLLSDADSKAVNGTDLDELSEFSLKIHPQSLVRSNNEVPPVYGLMVAIGMALREAV